MQKRQKIFISFLCIWSFVNIYVLIRINSFIMVREGINFILVNGHYQRIVPQKAFYPFAYSVYYYDYTELFVYVGGAWLLYFLYRIWSK